jgi:hypothetical protein
MDQVISDPKASPYQGQGALSDFEKMMLIHDRKVSCKDAQTNQKAGTL